MSGRKKSPRRNSMSRRSRGGYAVALLVALLVLPASVQAQGSGRRGGPPDREQLEQRIRAQMGRLMQQRLGLDQAQAAELAEVVQGFDARRRELFTLEQATRRRVEALILEDADDQQEGRELLGRMADLRRQEAQLFAEEQEALLGVLTPVQVLRLQELRQDLGRRIRALRGDRDGDGAQRDRRPRGPGPGAFRDAPRPPGPGPALGSRGPTERGQVRVL